MALAVRRPHAWLVMLVTASLAAWLLLACDSGSMMLSAFCTAGTPRSPPLSASFDLAVLLISPAKLITGSALMITAMMAPLIAEPLQHVHDRSFASRRARAMLVFIAGYAAAWLVAGVALQIVALIARWTLPEALLRLGLATGVAVLWQVSPAKQWFLNRCHNRPQLAAFGAAADGDALGFGLASGGACAGGCWALMLLPLLLPYGHLPAMLAIALFVAAERLDRPGPLAWHWRGPGKALRIAAARVRSP